MLKFNLETASDGGGGILIPLLRFVKELKLFDRDTLMFICQEDIPTRKM